MCDTAHPSSSNILMMNSASSHKSSPMSSDSDKRVGEGSSSKGSRTSSPYGQRKIRRGPRRSPTSPTESSFTFTDTMERSAFREEEGRLYNAMQDDYALPADPEEIERLNIHHDALRLLIGRNYVGPVETFLNAAGPEGTGKRILDIGCGTAKWAVEMALEFPRAEFVGMDLVPIQPDELPDNLSIVYDDLLAGLPFPPETFDMVHVRQLCFGIRDHSALFRNVATILKPGGLLLTCEAETAYFASSQKVEEIAPSTAYLFGEVVKKGLEARGLDPYAALRIPSILQDTGLYEDIDTTRADAPLSPWSNDSFLQAVGKLMRESAKNYPEVIKLILMDGTGLSAEDYDALRLGHIAELDDLKANLMMSIWMTWGTRK